MKFMKWTRLNFKNTLLRYTEIQMGCCLNETYNSFLILFPFLQQELEARQKKGLIDKNILLLTVEDPKARVGSGGATLNALYVVAEYLGAKLGHTIVTTDILQKANIILIHMGRNFPLIHVVAH